MISFKTFLLNESIFTILDSVFLQADDNIETIAAIWMFCRTNQARKGVVALHRFYEANDKLIADIVDSIRHSHPAEYEQAHTEIEQYFNSNKVKLVKNTLTNYFSGMQHDADLGPITQRGPRLPSKRIGAVIAPSRRAFGLPSR